MKLGVIGLGNMGGAIVTSILSRGILPSTSIFVHDTYLSQEHPWIAEKGLQYCANNEKVMASAPYILLAVKPQGLTTLAAEIRPFLQPHHQLWSILAGVSLERLQEAFGGHKNIVRINPNLGCVINQGMTAITSPSVTQYGESVPSLAYVEEVFRAGGKVMVVKENQIDYITALSGSGSGHFFYLLECFEKAASDFDLDTSAVRPSLAQTMMSSASIILEGLEDPAEWRQKVTSKGGTTAESLRVMRENGMERICTEALAANLQRSKELNGN